jgi:hypothetical protein
LRKINVMGALTIISERFFLRTGIYSGNTNPVLEQAGFDTELLAIDTLNISNEKNIALKADFVTSGDTIASYDQSNDFNVGNTPISAP